MGHRSHSQSARLASARTVSVRGVCWRLCFVLLSMLLATGCKSPAPQPSPAAVAARPAVQRIPAVQPAAFQELPVSPALPYAVAAEDIPAPEARAASPSQRLTLDEAIAVARSQNPRLRQMGALAQMARANADVAYAPFLPEFGSSFRYSGFTVPVLPGGSFVPASLNAGVESFIVAEAGVQYTIADFGRRAGRYGEAVHRARSQNLAWARAEQTIAFETTEAYFRLLAAEAMVRVRKEALLDAQRILDDTKARRDGGVAERESVLRADVELSLARQTLLTAQQAVQNARAQLCFVLGMPASAPLSVVQIVARPQQELSLFDCLEQAIVSRREIAMAREAVAEASHGLQAARGERKPKVFVRGTALRADSPGSLNGFVEGIGLHVEQPLYAGGRFENAARASEAQIAAAMAGLHVVLNNVSLQVCLAYQAIDADRQRIDLAQTSVAQARENLRLTEVRYQNGDATPTDVVDAQTALVQTETSYYTSVYGYLEGLARLEYAMGGDQQQLLRQIALESAPADGR